MISGTISLYDRSGEFIDSKEYKGKHDRKKIVDGWKSDYGEGYELCFLQISPDVNIQMIDRFDGTNRKSKYNIQKL